MGEALWPNGSQFLHLDVWRLGVSELGIYSALGVVGSGMKMMDVVYIPGEVQHPGLSFTAAADAGLAERYSGNHSWFIYHSQSPQLCREVTG